jgi:translation initiation factor 3 subunit K
MDANLTVLKLYQLNPDLYNADIAVKILLKAVVQLPEPDITTAKCLLDQAKVDFFCLNYHFIKFDIFIFP